MSHYYLVVEDNPIDMLVTKSLVEAEGAVPLCATDGFSALEELNSDEEDAADISLIIVDLNMPNMNGLELIRRIRRSSKYAETPVLVTSARREPDEVKMAIKAGATDYLVKPLDHLLFKEKLGFLVGSKQKWAEYEVLEKDNMNAAHMMTSIKLLSISEVGASLEINKEMKEGVKFGLISKMLLDAQVGQLLCMVESCLSGKNGAYITRVRFIGLAERKRKAIRILCRKLWSLKKNESEELREAS